MKNQMKKITAATVKSFINKNKDKLFINIVSDFDPMCDGVKNLENNNFKKATLCNYDENSQGVAGLWLVGRSRDYFNRYEKDNLIGYEVYNSCGNWIVAIKSN